MDPNLQRAGLLLMAINGDFKLGDFGLKGPHLGFHSVDP